MNNLDRCLDQLERELDDDEELTDTEKRDIYYAEKERIEYEFDRQ